MAGSFNHIVGDGGGWNLIENMGDAYEAVEELLFLVLAGMPPIKAERLLEAFYAMDQGDLQKDEVFDFVQERMDRESQEGGYPDTHLAWHQLDRKRWREMNPEDPNSEK